MKLLRTWLVLGRVSNLPTVWTNCLAGMVLVAGALEGIGSVTGWGAVMAGVSLLYVGGMFLNDFVDAGWDREHAPERPIPAGAISRQAVLVCSVLLLGFGWVLLVRVGDAENLWAGVLVAAIVLYDLLHKRWVGSVMLMGLCRFAVYVSAGTAVVGAGGWAEMPLRLWVAAGAMFFYVVGITLAARGERSGGVVKGVAWVCLLVPVGVWGWMGVTGAGVVVLLIVAWWMWRTIGHLRVKADKRRIGGFVGGLLAGIVVVDALLVSGVDARAAWVCVAMLPVCRWWQARVPAT